MIRVIYTANGQGPFEAKIETELTVETVKVALKQGLVGHPDLKKIRDLGEVLFIGPPL